LQSLQGYLAIGVLCQVAKMGCLNFFFWSVKTSAPKDQTAPDFGPTYQLMTTYLPTLYLLLAKPFTSQQNLYFFLAKTKLLFFPGQTLMLAKSLSLFG